MMAKYKYHYNSHYGRKLPRKLKKRILGRKLNKRKLKELIESVRITRHKETNELIDIEPYDFCPQCGCRATQFIDHNVGYPEIWIEDRCLRCNAWVGGADNSRYEHILEWKDNNGEIRYEG